MCAVIEANADALGIDKNGIEIVTTEALAFLRAAARKIAEPSLTVGLLPRSQPFDIIFFDPPYAADYETILNSIGEHAASILHSDAIVMVEHDKRKQLSDQFNTMKRYREVKQGDSVLSFYQIR